MQPGRTTDHSGLFYALAAYGWWGIVAIYFKMVAHVPPLEILSHRVIWSVVMLLAIITLLRRWPPLLAILRSRRSMLLLIGSTLLIAVNWYIFIWAVTREHLLEASLGYFINPLVSVLLGFLFLGERLRPAEKMSVALVVAAVGWLTFASGVVPWVALTLALTFGLYGLLRKLAGIGAIEGLTFECLFLLPLAAGYFVLLAGSGQLLFGSTTRELDLLLIAAGPVTALPLVWFASAVRRLRLATIGLLQFISPTMQFVLAVAVFNEPFDKNRLIAFLFIWAAVGLFAFDNARRHRSRTVVPADV
jgi:chloramphenicol-sensitive protein RarD